METLSRNDYLEIIVALDNEAAREAGNGNKVMVDRLTSIKWKMFALMVQSEKEAA